MGDPRKQRKKYTGPSHPWEGERIQKENELVIKYGLKNKKEVWRAKSAVGNYRQQARNLLGSVGSEAEKDARELLNKLTRLGILTTYSLEGVLALTIDDLLNRRLQTIVRGRGLANSVKQARQFVTHKHIIVGDNVIDVPGYIVPTDKEEGIRTRGISLDMIKPLEEKPAEVMQVSKKEKSGKDQKEHEKKEEVKVREKSSGDVEVKEEIKPEKKAKKVKEEAKKEKIKEVKEDKKEESKKDE